MFESFDLVVGDSIAQLNLWFYHLLIMMTKRKERYCSLSPYCLQKIIPPKIVCLLFCRCLLFYVFTCNNFWRFPCPLHKISQGTAASAHHQRTRGMGTPYWRSPQILTETFKIMINEVAENMFVIVHSLKNTYDFILACHWVWRVKYIVIQHLLCAFVMEKTTPTYVISWNLYLRTQYSNNVETELLW